MLMGPGLFRPAGRGRGRGGEHRPFGGGETDRLDSSLAEDHVASVRAEQEPPIAYLKVPKKHDVSPEKTYPHHVQDASPRAPQLDHVHEVLQSPPMKDVSAQESISQGSPEVAQADTEPIKTREGPAGAELAMMREQLQRLGAELQRVTAKNAVLDAAGHSGYLWLKYCENLSLSRCIAELEGRLKKHTSEAQEAKESLSQMAVRLFAAMNGLDAANLEKKDLQSTKRKLSFELARAKAGLTSELARARMDIKFKTCEIASLKSRNSQRSQLLRAVQDELEMRRLNDQELMEENERVLSLLAKANGANEVDEANKVDEDDEINEENEPNGGNEEDEENEQNERIGGNDAEEVDEVNGVNGVNSAQAGEHRLNEQNEGNENNEGDENNEEDENNGGNQKKELAEKVMKEASDFAILDTYGGS